LPRLFLIRERRVPRIPYKNRAGKRLSGATTVISANLGWNKEALKWWASRLALVPYEEAYAMLSRILMGDAEITDSVVKKFLEEHPVEDADYKKVSGEACDAGTLAHKMAENDVQSMLQGKKIITDLTGYVDKVIELANVSFSNYLTWKKMYKLKPMFTEVHIVCEDEGCQYGATPDLIAEISGVVALPDYKTSKAIYPDYLIQAGAYEHAWNSPNSYVMDGRNFVPIREFCKHKITGGYHGLRFDKESSGFDHKHVLDLSDAWEAFKLIRRLHDLKKVIK
jgi:hypothetical protein